MKKILKSVALTVLILFSGEVLAKRNYFQEFCHFDTVQGEVSLYKSEFWFGHHMTLISDVPGLDDYQEIYLPGKEGTGDDPVKGQEAIVFENVEDQSLNRVEYDDGCWQGFNIYFDRSAKIQHIQPEAGELLDLKKNDRVELKCRYENLIMSGSKCDQL